MDYRIALDNNIYACGGTWRNSGNILLVISIKDFLGVMMKKIIVLLLVMVLVSPIAFSADKPKSDTGNRIVIVFYTGLTIWGLSTGVATGLAYAYFTGALFGAKTLKAIAAKPEK